MNIFDLLESPGMGRPRDTKGIQSADDQSAASVIGSGTTKREAKKKPVTMMGMNVKESSAHDNFKKSVKDRGYDMDAGAKRLEDLLAKQKREREERERAEQGNEVKEAHPNQQISIYNPDGPTYRQEKMPGYDVDDIFSRGKAVDLDPEAGDINAPEDHLDAAEKANLKQILKKYMEKLNPMQRNVLMLRYWQDHTLESAGTILGVTPERVRQIEARAMRTIRQADKGTTKDLLGLSQKRTDEGILDRGVPKMPKPRNPANAVLGNKVNAAGKHLDKKRRQELNPKHKHQDPLAESTGQLNWTIHFDDGTSQQVTVPSDEFDVRGYFAKRGKKVVKIDYSFAAQDRQDAPRRGTDDPAAGADSLAKAQSAYDRGLTEQEVEEEFRLGKKLGTRRDRFKSLRKRKDGILGEVDVAESQVVKITDYDTWSDEVKALGGEIHTQRDRNLLVAQSWDGEEIGKFHLGKSMGFINRSGDLDETIRKMGSQYRLLSKKGKNLGTFDSKAGAEKHEREVQYFKHKNMEEGVAEAEIPSIYSKQVPPDMEHRARYKCPNCGIANKVQDWAANDNECPTCLEPLPHGLNQMPLKYQGVAEDALAEDIESHLYLMSRAGYDIVQEAWSDKYKRSINCSNPKGFSQKAHCAGKKKNKSVSEAVATPPAQTTDPYQQKLLDRMGARFGLQPGATMDQVQAAQQAYLDKNDPAAAAQYKQNMTNIDTGNTAANKPVQLAPKTPDPDTTAALAAGKANKSPTAIMLSQPSIGQNQAMLDVIAPTLGLPVGSSLEQLLAADDARHAKGGGKYAPSSQPVGEDMNQAVDSKGRTQQQWMQLVKDKFPDAKIIQSKMINGPCQAILSDGRKLSWSKVKEDVAEEKVRLDPKCWTGKKIGNPKTKMKGGVRVNNCVPK